MHNYRDWRVILPDFPSSTKLSTVISTGLSTHLCTGPGAVDNGNLGCAVPSVRADRQISVADTAACSLGDQGRYLSRPMHRDQCCPRARVPIIGGLPPRRRGVSGPDEDYTAPCGAPGGPALNRGRDIVDPEFGRPRGERAAVFSYALGPLRPSDTEGSWQPGVLPTADCTTLD